MRVTSLLRVVHLAKYAPTRRGGIETVTRELLASLGRHPGLEVDCYCYDSTTGEDQVSATARVLRRRTTFVLGTTPVSLGLLRDYRRVRRYADVVHLHLPNPWSALLVALFPTEAAIVVSLHAVSTRRTPLRRWYAAITDRVLRRADAIVVSAKANSTAFGLDPYRHKVKVVPFGLDPARLQLAAGGVADTATTPTRRARVLFVGRLVYYKGLDTLLEAAKYVDAEFVIVGEGPWYPRLLKKVTGTGLADRVRFAGNLDDAGLAEQLRSCTLLVQPSCTSSETFGLSVLEAMAFGKPVIVTALGTGLDELVRTADCGLIVAPNDSHQLAGALSRLLANPAERNRLGANGRRAFQQRYTSDEMTRRVVDIYDALTGTTQPTAVALVR